LVEPLLLAVPSVDSVLAVNPLSEPLTEPTSEVVSPLDLQEAPAAGGEKLQVARWYAVQVASSCEKKVKPMSHTGTRRPATRKRNKN